MTERAENAGAKGRPAAVGSTAPSLWLREWVSEHQREDEFDPNFQLWPWGDFLRLLWWSTGATRDARQRAGRFRDCIIEGRTERASFTVAAR